MNQNRRHFLQLSGLLGLGAVSVGALAHVQNTESVRLSRAEFKVSKTRLALGTFVDITAIHESRDQAEDAIGAAFVELDRIASLMTRFGNQSPICELNANAHLEHTPSEIDEILARSFYFYRDTNGAFDITVKPVIDLFEKRFSAGQKPSDAELNETLSLVGTQKIQIQNGGLAFADSRMGITLDGVAPGFIADKISEFLTRHGVSNHLVNAGGEIRVSGNALEGKAWNVAIQDPSKKGQYPGVLAMHNGAVSTSGNYEIFYGEDKMFHHIVDAKTGRSPQLATSVTVTAPTATDADILSTAVFVMDPQEGLDYINARDGYECLIIDRDGRQWKSSHWNA